MHNTRDKEGLNSNNTTESMCLLLVMPRKNNTLGVYRTNIR